MSFFLPSITSYFGVNSLSTSTARSRFGRSLMWPSDALTMKFFPRYLLIVFAFVGDSTITSAFAICQLPAQNKPRYTQTTHVHDYHRDRTVRQACRRARLPHFNKVPAGLLPDEAKDLQFKQRRYDFGRRCVFHRFDESIEVSGCIDLQLPEHPSRCDSLRTGFAWYRCGVCRGRFNGIAKSLIQNALATFVNEAALGGLGQFDDHVVPVLNQFRALFNEQVGAPAHFGGDVAGDREDLSSLLNGESGGD